MQEQHLNGAQVLIALGIMGGVIFAVCLIFLTADWRRSIRKKRSRG